MSALKKGAAVSVAVAGGVLCALIVKGQMAGPPTETSHPAEGSSKERQGVVGSAHRQGRAALRRPVRIQTAPVVETDPSAPSYDPVRLSQMLDRSPSEIVDREPVDEAWSAAFEESLSRVVARDLASDLPTAELVGVECKTSSCRVTVAVDVEDELLAYEFMQVFIPLGTVVEPQMAGLREDGRRELVFDALQPPDTRDPDEFERWYEADRAATAEKLAGFRQRSQAEQP